MARPKCCVTIPERQWSTGKVVPAHPCPFTARFPKYDPKYCHHHDPEKVEELAIKKAKRILELCEMSGLSAGFQIGFKRITNNIWKRIS